MKRNPPLNLNLSLPLILPLFLALTLPGCEAGGEADAGIQWDYGLRPDPGYIQQDVVADSVDDDAEAAPDSTDVEEWAWELPTLDHGGGDNGGVDNGGIADPGVTQDVQDPGPHFCRSFQDCTSDEVCVFSLGECQTRGTWTDYDPAVDAFHPSEAAAGDVLIVDARRLMAGLTTQMPRARIGEGASAQNVLAAHMQADENRMLIKVQSGMAGKITLWDFQGKLAGSPGSLLSAPSGVIPCDGKTPEATGEDGTRPGSVGPYAAGYVDIGDAAGTRVFYPAVCGSLRRPPVEGTWPLVAILHGNGATHLQYEYLAELLATWGFVSFMPATDMNMAGEPFDEMLKKLMPVVRMMWDQDDLGLVHPVLAGVGTTPDIAFVGHSRGTGRAEEVLARNQDIKDMTVGAVFLGPVDDGLPIPGGLLVFGGKKDSQSGSSNYTGPYNKHNGPKILVEFPGGNHGSFCDHKVYGYTLMGALGDLEPTIPRSRQLYVVQTFTVPFFQKAFGLTETFPGFLSAAPTSSDHTIQRNLGDW
jgi:hypothetical protein